MGVQSAKLSQVDLEHSTLSELSDEASDFESDGEMRTAKPCAGRARPVRWAGAFALFGLVCCIGIGAKYAWHIHTPNFHDGASRTGVESSISRSLQTGQCTKDDFQVLDELRLHPLAFFQNMSDCARFHSISWKFTWLREAFTDCMSKKMNRRISHNCLDCYSKQSSFSFTNCKGPCLCSWCSKTCLQCVAKHNELPACVGRPRAELPVAPTC